MSTSRSYGQNDSSLDLRPAKTVMDIARLGTLHPYRLSFIRILIRRLMNEDWKIECKIFHLDKNGYGDVIYEINTPSNVFSFVAFTQALDDDLRSDRVIAEQWDMAVTLCVGKVEEARLEKFRQNVPLQEKGRLDPTCLVLSRANKSGRNFEQIVRALASGHQPSISAISKVGYLYRTTAVYGSGKFGMADWQKVQSEYSDFASPFMAEMLTCFMIRHLSLELAEYLALQREPETAVSLEEDIRRYIGIGNATGLGMAPYLINHPQLISRWVEVREIALARVLIKGKFSEGKFSTFQKLVVRTVQHLSEIDTDNLDQNKENMQVREELLSFCESCTAQQTDLKGWKDVASVAAQQVSSGTLELVHSLIMELFPECVDDLEDRLKVEEGFELIPQQNLQEFKKMIEQYYAWVLDIDFSDVKEKYIFWYRSEEKMEPRLGIRNVDIGMDREIDIGIGFVAQKCYKAICVHLNKYGNQSIAEFVFNNPHYRKSVRRIQTMAQTCYGEIRANLLAEDVLPIHLLRCKLAFLGVSKFDPRSRLWVRNTMFQGAPVVSDIGKPFQDDWAFPVAPKSCGNKNVTH